MVAAQLAVVVALVYAFKLESRTFFDILLLACGGFVVSAILPARHRLWFFAALSMLSVVLVVGPDAASAVLALGLLIIVVCHLPLRFRLRVGLVVLIGVGLAILRHRGNGALALDVLAAMFMFRVALYLYALRHTSETFHPSTALAYFFMLPNACFPLFPVVDLDAFRRGSVDEEELATYERGLRWVFRGLAQLLLLRIVTFRLAIDDLAVNDLGDIVRYVVTCFLLYLDVSGKFHLIVGLVSLFGFRMPETHHRYFLASSVMDFWRRINIYWKDFMTKLVYLPAYFALRRHGTRLAIAMSTGAVFAATWALHSYQEFWLLGKPRASWQDASFWAVFGAFMVVASLRTKRPEDGWSRGPLWSRGRAVSTLFTMLGIFLLWSYWNAQSAETWLYLWTRARFVSGADVLLLIAVVLGFAIIAGFNWDAQRGSGADERTAFHKVVKHGVIRGTAGVLLVTTTLPPVFAQLPLPVKLITNHLRGSGVSVVEERARVAGYYEGLAAPRSSIRRWESAVHTGLWKDAPFAELPTGDFLWQTLRRGFRGVVGDKEVSVNQWAMRDREYSREKPPGTFRIALLGPSDVMGWGVGDDDVFEGRVERSLDSLAAEHGNRVEILNISVPGWSLPQQVHAIRAIAAPFSPDLVLLTVHSNEIDFVASRLADLVSGGIPVPDSILSGMIDEVKIAAGMGRDHIARLLRPVEDRWHARVVAWAKESAAGAEARLAVMELRLPASPRNPTVKPLRRAINEAGVEWLDCADPYRGHDEVALWVGPGDNHPNAAGHALISHCVLQQLMARPHLLPIWQRSARR